MQTEEKNIYTCRAILGKANLLSNMGISTLYKLLQFAMQQWTDISTV